MADERSRALVGPAYNYVRHESIFANNMRAKGNETRRNVYELRKLAKIVLFVGNRMRVRKLWNERRKDGKSEED